MLVMSWNIEKNNREKIRNVAAEMRAKIALVNGDVFLNGPWVLGILESKDRSDVRDDTVNDLMAAFNADWGRAAPAGGGTNTSENVLLIGKGCQLLEEPFTVEDWKIGFNNFFGAKVEEFKAKGNPANRRASPREHVVAATTASYNAVDAWEADKCRNPVFLQVHDGQQSYRLAFVHSPGPGEYSFAARDVKYAEKYLELILPWLSEKYKVDLLIGDFNIHGSDPQPLHGLQRVPSGPTTLSRKDGTPSSPLDRAYIGPNYTRPANVFIYPCTREISDHMGIGVKLLTHGAMLQAAADNGQSMQLNNHLSYNMPGTAYAQAHKKRGLNDPETQDADKKYKQ